MIRLSRRTVWKVIRCLFPLWCVQTFKCLLSPLINTCYCCCGDTHQHQDNYELFIDDDLPPSQPLNYDYAEPTEYEQRTKVYSTIPEQKREYVPPTLPSKLHTRQVFYSMKNSSIVQNFLLNVSQELQEIRQETPQVEQKTKTEGRKPELPDSQTFG